MVIKEIYVSRRCQPPPPKKKKKTNKKTNKQTKQNKIKQKSKTKPKPKKKTKQKNKQNKKQNRTETKRTTQHKTHQNRLKYSECGHQVSRGYRSIFISLCRDGDSHEADQVKSIAAFSACTKLMENVSYIPDTSLILLYISDLITRVTFSDSKKEVSHVALYYHRTYKRIVSAPDGPHVGPMNLAIRDLMHQPDWRKYFILKCILFVRHCSCNVLVLSGGFHSPWIFWHFCPRHLNKKLVWEKCSYWSLPPEVGPVKDRWRTKRNWHIFRYKQIYTNFCTLIFLPEWKNKTF